MNWIKKGLIYSPNGNLWWNKKYSILPTPVYLEMQNVIRVFFAVTCENNLGRITFIDLDPQEPCLIKSNPNLISLDLGEDGAFDDCGVNPSCVIKNNEDWTMYYAGYQRHYKTPYSIFSGLAKSSDGINFTRVLKTPILERTSSELSLRSAPTVINDNNLFKMIYVSDHGWKEIKSELYQGRKMPLYSLKYAESVDGIIWKSNFQSIMIPQGEEFGFGRPYLLKDKNLFKLFYSIRSINKSYRLGYAESFDCVNWIRKDLDMNIDVSESGWDSEMICYPAVINVKGKVILFYNGNNNGESGFGYAEISS